MAGEAITDYSDMIARATGAATENLTCMKTARIAGVAAAALVAGRWTSLWQYDGAPGGYGSGVPSSTAANTGTATNGALMQAVPATGAKKRLISFAACSLVSGTLAVVDRMMQQGGLSGTVTTAQTVSSPAFTRWTNGIGVEAAAEIYTAVGTTATTIKLSSYTNTVPTAAQAGQLTTFGSAGWNNANRWIPLPLASGDKGITAVSTVTVTATTGTAGSFGVTLFKRIAMLPLGSIGVGAQWNCLLKAGGPFDIAGGVTGSAADSCLSLALYPNTTTVPEIFAQFILTEK